MSTLRISVLISGGGTNLEALIDSIRQQAIPARVVQVISSDPKAYGLERARNHGIPVQTLPADLQLQHGMDSLEQQEKLLLDWLEEAETDLVVLAGYLKKIPDRVLRAYPNKIMNIHPSLVPAFSGPGWYGMKVHEGVWRRGAKITGATVHFVNEEMDGGPIVLQEAVYLDDEDDPAAISQKVLAVEHRLLPQAVALFTEGKLRVEQHRVYLKKAGNQL